MATGYLPVIILVVVFVLIAVRKIGHFRIKIWQAMTGGAIVVLATGQIGLLEAALAINLDVMFFLFGMFVIGESMEASGYLRRVSHHIFRGVKNVDQLILLSLFAFGLLSALLMNDTLAIVGTPVVLAFSRRHHISPKLLLLTLAFAVTTGSVISPIGNPQNLLIATEGNVTNPFVTFIMYLALPTVLSLIVAFFVLRVAFRSEFGRPLECNDLEDGPIDLKLMRLSRASLALVLLLIIAKVVMLGIAPSLEFRLSFIALLAAIPILLFSERRTELVKHVDWATLMFFASMFVLMASVWSSGVFQDLFVSIGLDVTSIPSITAIGLVLSQLISNVPLVALYIPLLTSAGASTAQMMALVASSTLAGNMLILGAASNVIIIQNAEKQGETLSITEFAKVGIPLTLVQAAIYMTFLLLVQ